MKKIFVVLALILSFCLLGCEQAIEKAEDTSQVFNTITIYPLDNQTNTIVIEDTETIKMFIEAVENAEKQPGIVDMANPEYRMELGDIIYFLWIDEKYGTIMDAKDTHTIYSLTEKATREVYDFLKEQGVD